MVNPRFERLFHWHSLLASSALQILTFPSFKLTYCLNTATGTTMTHRIFRLPLTRWLVATGRLAQAWTTLAWSSKLPLTRRFQVVAMLAQAQTKLAWSRLLSKLEGTSGWLIIYASGSNYSRNGIIFQLYLASSWTNPCLKYLFSLATVTVAW